MGGGGYSGTLGFGLSDNFHGGGGHSDLDSLTNFILGGILGHSDLDSLTIFIGGGGYSGTLRFGLSDNFYFGGYSGTLRFGLSDNFHFGGRGRGVFYRIGIFCGVWTKISTTPAGSCITDSLSHTTYVETNKSIDSLIFVSNSMFAYLPNT